MREEVGQELVSRMNGVLLYIPASSWNMSGYAVDMVVISGLQLTGIFMNSSKSKTGYSQTDATDTGVRI